jgi:hypothetical protein
MFQITFVTVAALLGCALAVTDPAMRSTQHAGFRPSTPAAFVGHTYRRPAARRPRGQLRDGPVLGDSAPTPKLPGPRRLVQLAFMHRHGARTAPVVSHGVLDWSRCHLSGEGANMARSLGRFLRGRYGANNSTDTAARYNFIPRYHNASEYYVRSTDYERTIRTGVGVVRGLFPEAEGGSATNRAAFLRTVPYVAHEAQNADIQMGYYYSWPSAVLRVPTFDQYNPSHDVETRAILSPANLTTLGEVLRIPKMCATAPTTCALFAEDVGTCWRSNVGIAPRFRALLPQLFLVQHQSFNYLYGYTRRSRFNRNSGAYGVPIATLMLRQFQDALAFHARPAAHAGAGAPFKVNHYSAHDITDYGLLVALGVNRPGVTNTYQLVPRFTTLIMLELYSDATVTLVYAHCGQEMKSAYNFTVDAAPTLTCIDVAGKTYFAATCLVDDLKRFVAGPGHGVPGNATKTVDPCYADPVDVALSQCDPHDAGGASQQRLDAVGPGDHELRVQLSSCVSYRQLCPRQACDPRLVSTSLTPRSAAALAALPLVVLDRINWKCVPLPTPAAVPTFPSKAPYLRFGLLVWAGIVLGLLLGAVAGIVKTRHATYHNLKRNEALDESLPFVNPDGTGSGGSTANQSYGSGGGGGLSRVGSCSTIDDEQQRVGSLQQQQQQHQQLASREERNEV